MSAWKPDDLGRVEHIQEALDELESFVEGYDLSAFEADRKTFLSCIKLMEVIGEAAYHLTPELKNKFPHIPWPQMEGMRHRLVHEYYFIDPEIAWKVATHYAPLLQAEITAVIEFLQKNDA